MPRNRVDPEVKRLTGRDKYHPTPPPAAPLDAVALAPPRDLAPDALHYWLMYAPLVADLGNVKPADAIPLRLLCEALAEVDRLSEEIASGGTTYTTDTGYLRPHPAVAQRAEAIRRTAMLLRMLGCCPQTRKREPTPPPPAELALTKEQQCAAWDEFNYFDGPRPPYPDPRNDDPA